MDEQEEKAGIIGETFDKNGGSTEGKAQAGTADLTKFNGYIGFAAKARKLQSGYNTVMNLIEKKKAKLVIIAEDAAEGTKEKISGKCRSNGVKCEVFGKGEELSHATGNDNGMVFAVTYKGFADVICKEIDRIRSEGE